MYTRKTIDEYEIQSFCPHLKTWELETTETTFKLAKLQAKTYRENTPLEIRIVKKRVKMDKKEIEKI
jgi:hypothetical protein